jgi:two-component system chemotaxis sensor kinase CheA
VNLDQALATFLTESRDLLQNMEDALLRLEQQPGDGEAVNALFRAAHTIKGSAGLFGLDGIVAFTHVVENTLDQVRGGRLAITPELSAVLLRCGDHIGTLVEYVAEHGGESSDEAVARAGDGLTRVLKTLTGPLAHDALHRCVRPPDGEKSAHPVHSDNWHISLRFGADALRNGLDPSSFLRYLNGMGDLVRVDTLTDAIPEGEAYDPEACYLGFEVEFHSAATKQAIEDVFEFVRDDCRVRILPPHCNVGEYMALIHDSPSEERYLGDMLLASGALTRAELEEGLHIQNAEPDEPGKRRLGEILVAQDLVQQPVVDAALDKQQQARDAKSKDRGFIRVPAEKLDRLINLVGELVIAGAGANLLAQQSGLGALQEATSAMGRLVEEIRDGALRLRMVEIGETFHRFNRVVRDVGKELGKEIDLVISGAETELDKGVVEKIGDPLMHLVRNAIDHGIESMDVRLRRGKPARGRLSLNAYHESGSIIIEVSDDGGGLKRDRIVARARERGVIGQSQELSDTEICQLIFEPGFSTAEQVTNLSGRGVGMDVVRKNIEALQGTTEVESSDGAGTTVRIRLPLTLAIIDGFLVGVGKNAYVVPLDMVQECVELSGADHKAGYVNLRGEVLPLLRLRDHFGSGGAVSRRESVVVVATSGQKAGFAVDELLGEFQTVIKPLGRVFQGLKGVSGSTILGNGNVALILDVPGLIQKAAAREGAASQKH